MTTEIKNKISEEYKKIKKGSGKPYFILANDLGIEVFDLYKAFRKIDSKFPWQIEEISFIIENKDKIPRWKLIEMFDLKSHDFDNIKKQTGISFAENLENAPIQKIKWLVEEELKFKIDDELPRKLSEELLRKYKLSSLRQYAYDLQKDNKELYPFPAMYILIDKAFPNQFKPWQFPRLKGEYWLDKSVGKIRLAEALRWLIEEKKKIAIDLIPFLKKSRTFVTTQDLAYVFLQDAFKLQFKSQEEYINFTYPDDSEKITRESAKILIEKLKQNNRIYQKCEICEIKNNLEFHHIIPLWYGGDNEVENIICICSNHHTEAHKNNFHKKILSEKIKESDRVNFFKTLFENNN